MEDTYPIAVRVLLDATVVTRHPKGAGRVILNLARSLPAVDQAREYLAVAFPQGAHAFDDRSGADVVTVPPSRALPWERRGLSEWSARLGIDAVITVREVVFPGAPRTVLHLAEPPAYRLRSGLRQRSPRHVAKDMLLQSLLRRSVRHAAAVTSASAATARWLQDRYRIDPPVIPPGIDPFFLEPGADRSGKPYLLHPATGDRRENTDLVLRAYAAATPPAELVLVGTPAHQAEGLADRAAGLRIARDAIRFCGWVTDQELRDLYRGAVALVHPARYEGFAGLQPLEAMAQGTPVIALEAPGVTEALRDVAELVPEDPVALGAAMQRLCGGDGKDLGERGMRFALGFTWERAARSFVEVLEGLPPA